jgi:type II secretion system protein G
MIKIQNSKFKIQNKFQIINSKFQNFGFTLIELLVVISIIGILAALIMVNFNAARERARDMQRKSDLDQIKKALRMYYNDNSQYPGNSSDYKIIGCGTGATPTTCNWNNEWARSGMVYMKKLPNDPSEGKTYKYQQTSSGQDFCLWATLENKSDGDIAKSKSRCLSCSVGAYEYVVCAD